MYRPTIGLEIHAELDTETKMFCGSLNNPDETRPNVNVCPVCLAHPGTLPVPNKEAIRHVLRVGTAVGGTLADFAEFDRKSYFYPDIPKGYQISQYEHPLVAGGELAGVKLTRIHLEEDTARSIHAGGESLVDFNRAGVPLMELVTEPVIHDAATAGRFARELQLLLRTLRASHANLEKGEMRIEANISVSKDDSFGTKVEVKNLNSFRSVERAIEFEVARQSKLLDEGGKVIQETRGFDEDKGTTFSQRVKEGSADYRYFPEPDIPKLVLSEISEFSKEVLRQSLPELPQEKRARLSALGIAPSTIETLISPPELGEYYDAVVSASNDGSFKVLAANYIATDYLGALAKYGDDANRIDAGAFSRLLILIADGTLSSRGAKDIIDIMVRDGGEAAEIAEREGLVQVSDTGALQSAVDAVVAREAKVVEEYRGGKEAVMGYLVGAVMKEMKGAGNPVKIREILFATLKA